MRLLAIGVAMVMSGLILPTQVFLAQSMKPKQLVEGALHSQFGTMAILA
jgi:hypothetical protein